MITPTHISLQIGDYLTELDRQMALYRVAEKDAAEKRTRYKVSQAKAYLANEGSIPERNALATVQTETALGESEVADALVRMLKADMHRIEVHIDALRTSAATVRAELRTLEHQAG